MQIRPPFLGPFRTRRSRSKSESCVRCEGVNAGRYPAAGHEFMIAAHLRMRKIARTEREREREYVCGTMSGRKREREEMEEETRGESEREREGECVTTLKKMPATRTKIKMITYPPRTYVRCVSRTHVRPRIGGGATRVRRKGQACAGMQDRYRDVL